MNVITRIVGFAILLLVIAMFIAVLVTTPARADVPAKGVEMFYLNNTAEYPYYMIDHASDPVVDARLNNMLDGYKSAGVTFVRVLFKFDFDPQGGYPLPATTRIAGFKTLLAKITSRGMKLELIFVGRDMDKDAVDYSDDKAWVGAFLDNLDTSGVQLVTLGGDTALCGAVVDHLACYPDADTPVGWLNMGRWITGMHAWAVQRYPKLAFSSETWIGWGDADGPSGAISQRVSAIFDKYISGSPYTNGPIYYELPPGSTWQDYASLFSRTIYRFRSFSPRPLWFDEFGMSVTNVANRAAYLRGFLTATGCAPSGYVGGEALWMAGNDGGVFGYIDRFDGNVPVWNNDWTTISQYYHSPVCDPPSVSSAGVVPSGSQYPVWVNAHGVRSPSFVELYDVDGSLWGVNIPTLVVNQSGLTFSLPSNLAPSRCNATTSCTVQARVLREGSSSELFDIVLPPQALPPPPQIMRAPRITAGGIVYAYHPPAVWAAVAGVTSSHKVVVSGAPPVPFLHDAGGVTFILPNVPATKCPTGPNGCYFFYVVDAVGTSSNIFPLDTGLVFHAN
jgi:hypothetical protein